MTMQSKNKDRCDAWYDGSAVCVIAVSSHGDPLDLADHEAEDLIAKLQNSLLESRAVETKNNLAAQGKVQ